jgi:YVTN family beta-propeller protein
MTLAKRIPLPKLPSHMAFNAASNMVFITQQGSDQVSAIDLSTQTVKWTLPVGKLPAGIAMTPDDKYLLVGIMGADYVEVIDWRRRRPSSASRPARARTTSARRAMDATPMCPTACPIRLTSSIRRHWKTSARSMCPAARTAWK